jgi:acetate---CoA ligase (ADP-forming)
MREFFYPTTVAVIGVSARETNLGRNIVTNLVDFGFSGIVYAVGPRGGMIQTRRIYKSVGDIPDHIDLAVILTPARTVPGVLEECGEKGIRWAIIETAGFREYEAEEGRKLEEEMLHIALKYGIRFVGPNCIGAINMENGFCVPFPIMPKDTKKGDISIITQSGGIGMSVMNLMTNEGLGLNKFVSIGNALDTSAVDLLQYMIEDPGTKLIYMYLESIRNGQQLMEVARKSNKPILAFKSNIGKFGQNIALSHTASLTSDDKVVDAAFHQSGILRVRDDTSLGNYLKILRLPPIKGKNLAIISRSGGHAVIGADACELSNFNLAHFPDSFLREIEKNFRASVIRLTNPLDLGDLFDLDVYAEIVERTLKLSGVDGVIFLHTSLTEEENYTSRKLLERLIQFVETYDKPVAYYISSTDNEVNYLKQHYDFPIFTQIVETIRALEIQYYHNKQSQLIHNSEEILQCKVQQEAARDLIEKAKKENRDLLLSESLSLLEYYGISTVNSIIAMSVDEAQEAASKLGYPVAIKIVAEQISHKSDVGGVQLNLRNKSAVASAFEDMMTGIHTAYPDAKIDGVIVQPMVTGGRELILGGRHDPQFGSVVMLGLGGIFVEIFDESVVRVAPISRREALEMIQDLRGYQILAGARGHKASDIETLVDFLLRLSQLLRDFPEIKELDINPLRLFKEEHGARALDARIILK